VNSIRHLALPARIYVGGVIAAGTIVLFYCAAHAEVSHWKLFLSLVALSCVAATLKLHLPLTRGDSTMSASYVVDFTSLLLLGPEPTVFVAAASALTQSTFNVPRGGSSPTTLFNMAAIVTTIEAAGLVFARTGGQDGRAWPHVLTPLMAAATYAPLVTPLRFRRHRPRVSTAGTAARLERQLPLCAPSYFRGSLVGAIVGERSHRRQSVAPAGADPPVCLTFRSYKVYLGRLEAERVTRNR
jgi:hypothetical protein